jgi:hypothetical protein
MPFWEHNRPSATTGEFFAKGPPALDLDWFSLHGQTTFLEQYAFPFRVPYRGPHSLIPPKDATQRGSGGTHGRRTTTGALHGARL